MSIGALPSDSTRDLAQSCIGHFDESQEVMAMVERIDPKDCEHVSVGRIIDTWRCNVCRVEFKPVDPAHKTKWKRTLFSV